MISLVTGGGGGGKHFSKTFSIFYMLNGKNRVFNPDFLKRYLSNEKNTFADSSRVETISFLMEKLSFSLKLVAGHFYGHSFIKTVRGPCSDFTQLTHKCFRCTSFTKIYCFLFP